MLPINAHDSCKSCIQQILASDPESSKTAEEVSYSECIYRQQPSLWLVRLEVQASTPALN